MLRITEVLGVGSDRRAVRTLRIEGTLKGAWVAELRRVWRRETGSAGGSVRVELADVTFVDAAGKLLLVEMHRDGVEIAAHGVLSEGVRDEVVGSRRPGRGGD